MLTADEYINQYISYDRRALQLSKHYLSRWAKVERNASQLDEMEKETAFLLFSVLKELTEKERQFLGDKYRVIISRKQAKPDSELAEDYDMNFKEYNKLRRGLEYKFYHFLKPLLLEHVGEDFFL